MTYSELVNMSEEELYKLVSDPKMKKKVLLVLDERARARHNKLTYRQMKKSPNKCRGNKERYMRN